MFVFEERGKPEYPEKTSLRKDESQQQTQPTYDAESGNRTQGTLVGGESSHHCGIPTPQIALDSHLLHKVPQCSVKVNYVQPIKDHVKVFGLATHQAGCQMGKGGVFRGSWGYQNVCHRVQTQPFSYGNQCTILMTTQENRRL